MKKTFLLLLISCFSFLLHAQQDNVWAFGEGIGLDFNAASPPASISTAMNEFAGEAAASVCDASGQLLFYTQGNRIWDRNGNIMPNSDSLVGFYYLGCNYNHTVCNWNDPVASSVQGALIVPFPDDTNRYYVFSLTSKMALDTVFNLPGYLYYSIVDMSLNGGQGEVVAGQKGILIDSGFYDNEQMTSVVGADCNIWVVLSPTKMAGDSVTFKSYKVDAGGLNTTPVISKAGLVPGSFIRGATLCFSPDRTKLALTRDAIISGSVELYDFDPMTGEVSNQQILNPNLNTGYYGACFSPDNSKLYTSAFFGGIIQYDLSSGNTTTIINSSVCVDSLSKNTRRFTGLKLGPDGKIYYNGRTKKVAFPSGDLIHNASIGRINLPNLSGAAALANDSAIILSTDGISYALPNVISIVKKDTTYATTIDSIICTDGGGLTLASPLDAATYLWSDGSTGGERTVTESGTYWVQSSNYCHFRTDTFTVDLVNLSPIIRVDEFELSTTRPYDSYQWYLNGNLLPGATNPTYIVTENGDYTVVVSANGCTDTSDIYEVNNTAIPNRQLEHLINIYPNPAQDVVYISSPFKVNVRISGMEGRLIEEKLNVDQMSLRGLAEGVYLLHISDQNGNILKVERIIKVK